MKNLQFKGVISFLFMLVFVGCSKKSSVDVDAELSYKKINDDLVFEVRLSATNAELSFYRNIEDNLILSVLPLKVKGRKNFVLTERTGEVNSVVISADDSYTFSFSGRVKSSAEGTTVDFGDLGYIEIPYSNKLFSLGVVIFPKNLSSLKSDDGIISNYVDIEI